MVDHESTPGRKSPLHPIPNAQPSPSPRSPPAPLNMSSSHSSNHRSSFAENMRGMPVSPRATRQPSLSQQALQELLNNPPTQKAAEPKFAGRDWRTLKVGEIVKEDEKGGEVRFVQYDTSVEEATNLLVQSGAPNVVLLREDKNSRTATGTFDYSDLNAYLLLVVGLAHPDEADVASFDELAKKGREGKPIPLKDVKDLGKKEPLITLPESADLTKAMEVFGSGVHRVLVSEEGTTNVIGVLTQLRLVRFFWENRQSFPAVDQLYPQLIKDLHLGSHTVIAINGDKPLATALELMHNEGVTSLAVLDAQNNVIGNISHVDVRLLTKSTSLPLLRSSCIHFISVILSERGVNDGKDSFPVFHITPFSTLAHTVAKLVATRSHRMWVVDAPSPASSGPPTPAASPAVFLPPPQSPPPAISAPSSTSASTSSLPTNPTAPVALNSATPAHLAGSGIAVAPSISASAIPTQGGSMSGRLSGVISLTDILNLFARASGLHPHDPDEARRARRRSSSSSMRRSMDSSRSESMGRSLSGLGVVLGSASSRRGSVNERERERGGNGGAATGLGITRGRGRE